MKRGEKPSLKAEIFTSSESESEEERPPPKKTKVVNSPNFKVFKTKNNSVKRDEYKFDSKGLPVYAFEDSDESDSSDKNHKDDRKSISEDDLSNSDDDGKVYCICQEHVQDAMVACDNESCAIEWFHFECMGIKSEPKGKWYCPSCRLNRHTPNKPKPNLD